MSKTRSRLLGSQSVGCILSIKVKHQFRFSQSNQPIDSHGNCDGWGSGGTENLVRGEEIDRHQGARLKADLTLMMFAHRTHMYVHVDSCAC